MSTHIRRCFLFLVLIPVLYPTKSQTKDIDSLKQELKDLNGIERIPVLIGLSDMTFFSDTEYSRQQAREALSLARLAKDTLAILNAYNLIGITYDIEGARDSSRFYFTKFYEASKRAGRIDRVAAALNNLGMWHWNAGLFQEALEWYFEAASLSDSTDNDVTLSKAYNNIGLIHQELNDYKKAKTYNLKALTLRKALSDTRGLIHSYNNLGICAKSLDQYDSAAYYYQQGLVLAESINDKKSIADINQNLGVLAELMGEPSQATRYLKKSLEYTDNPLSTIFAMNTLSGIYHDLGKPEESLSYAQKSLALGKETNTFGHLEDVYMNLTRAYILNGELEEAGVSMLKWDAVKDSIFSLQSAEKYNDMEVKYETEKKEQQLALQEAKLEEQNAIIIRNKVALVFAITTLLLILIIGLLWRNRMKKKQQIKWQEAMLDVKEAEINATISSQEKERARYARDLHDGFGQMISLLNLNLSNLKSTATPDERQQVFDESEEVINDMYGELKSICFDLMPQTLVNNGLPSALREFAERVNNSGQVYIETNFFDLDDRLIEILEISLYRISQEWINNVLKYSNADKITLQITRDHDEITLLIEDNGMGFDKRQLTNSKGNGWKNMHTRASLIQGTLVLESETGKRGSTLILDAPVQLAFVQTVQKENTMKTV